ncbi:MAG: hypothetical protein D6732_16110, partial [Methanobacteriota archaeon]
QPCLKMEIVSLSGVSCANGLKRNRGVVQKIVPIKTIHQFLDYQANVAVTQSNRISEGNYQN